MVPSMIPSTDHGITPGTIPGIIITMVTTPGEVAIRMDGGIIPVTIIHLTLILQLFHADVIDAATLLSIRHNPIIPV